MKNKSTSFYYLILIPHSNKKIKCYIQLNLVNSKSSGVEVLFRIISSSNYRDMWACRHKNVKLPEMIIISLFSQTEVLCS